MPQIRNVSRDERDIAHGLHHVVTVPADGVVDVPDEVVEDYTRQAIWELATPAAPDKTAEELAAEAAAADAVAKAADQAAALAAAANPPAPAPSTGVSA